MDVRKARAVELALEAQGRTMATLKVCSVVNSAAIAAANRGKPMAISSGLTNP